MNGFHRDDLLFSLCGLNCGLCPMKLDGYCPGCGGGKGNQSCAIARCSLEQGGVAYCSQCAKYPCERYRADDLYDSFITHRNRRQDLDRLQRIGPATYREEQLEKQVILTNLLNHYNDGRHKGFYYAAANLLPLEDLRAAMEQLAALPPDLSARERAAQAAGLFQGLAGRRGLDLKLRKKPRKPH